MLLPGLHILWLHPWLFAELLARLKVLGLRRHLGSKLLAAQAALVPAWVPPVVLAWLLLAARTLQSPWV